MIPTIRDVAKQSNVSVATVSRVLNGLTGYSDKTKQKVLNAIEEMGYQPNAIARSLSNKRTQTLGVMFPAVSDEFASAVLQGIEDFAHDQGYSVLVCNTAADGDRTLKYLQVLREKQVDGILFASEKLKDEYIAALEAMNVPMVLIASETHHPGIPYVKVDDRKAAYDATCYLIHQGHREIAMISGTKGDPIAGLPRIEGYRQALLDHRIAYREDRVAYGDFHFESGSDAMKSLLESAGNITAVFAASDGMAIGALNYALRQGISVPDKLSIIGYDNLKMSQMVIPSLTTVRQPLFELGMLASEKLITMIEESGPVENTIVEHEIVERHTVKAVVANRSI
ncbi:MULTISPECIES: LacI family DNA-binding transcriptional regulator [Paenibacillus]|uniref:LacI family DNA-binding transcriptional regulator n=1 Tax=Paenibacillus TaxID=44249 RepID=UPI0022B87AC6|nr:substrate-binding domain-containing protein [Paenibacillus caseinilyticus]MCZ8518303.1 substrate-binding domain-containing protein [Paenibacillus caseinilyticus]